MSRERAEVLAFAGDLKGAVTIGKDAAGREQLSWTKGVRTLTIIIGKGELRFVRTEGDAQSDGAVYGDRHLHALFAWIRG